MHLGLKLGTSARRGGGGGGGSGGSTVPDAFAAGGWSMATGSGEAELDITLSTLPSDGGATITDVEWAIAGSGSWASLPSYNGTGTYTITAPLASTSYEVFIRAVNSEGVSTGNTSKTATSGAAAASATMPAFRKTYEPSAAGAVYTQSTTGFGAGEFVVGIAYQSGGSGQTVSSMVVDGQTLTAEVAANSANVSGVALYRVTTTNTDWDIVLTMSGAVADGAAFFVWGPGSDLAVVDTASSGAVTDLDPAIAVNVDTETGGKVVGVASVLGTNPSYDDLTGVVLVTDADGSPFTISTNDRVAGFEASVTTGETPRSVAVGWTGGGVHHAIAVLSIGAA
jgi:hypothetical protein